MKWILLLSLISLNTFATTIEEAPTEWLIAVTIQNKIDDHGHLKINDSLVQKIFNSTEYDKETDELRLKPTKNENQLRKQLITFVKSNQSLKKSDDGVFTKWANEPASDLKVTLYKTNFKPDGYFFFNHIHTNISKDNSEMKPLKFTPQKTFRFFEGFLKRRRSKGAVAFCDHDTDKAIDQLKISKDSPLTPLRSIEWGGSTHMGLVGIKKNWDNITKGRDYKGEESIKQSRSSDGFRIVNHPNRKKPAFPYTSWLDANGVEVWNTIVENSPFLRFNIKRSNNRIAFQQWVDSLKTGKTYTAVSGSDFHFAVPCLRDRTLFYPLNFIPGDDTAKTEEYLNKGRVSFITRPSAPNLILQAKFEKDKEWAQMGDQITGKKNLEVQLFGDFSDTNKRIGGVCYNTVRKFYRLITFWKKQFWQIRFYNLKGEMIAKRAIRPNWYSYKKHFKAVIQLPVEGKDLVRAELWAVNKKSQSIDLLGATNPIYINW